MEITTQRVSTLELILRWSSTDARHTDRLYVRKVNFWRDIFPGEVRDDLMGKREGDVLTYDLLPGKIVPPFDEGNIFPLERLYFDSLFNRDRFVEPRFGRFYPKGMLKALPGIFRSNMEPFRCVGVDDASLMVDFNHPLSQKDIGLTVLVRDVRQKLGELGGSCNDWLAAAADGPGMQARWRGNPTDFFADDPYRRPDESSDSLFYREPRFVTHVDDKALEVITGLYETLLAPDMKVLDLMSSVKSHLPARLTLRSVTGLGLNSEEMAQNRQLTSSVVHDVNEDPVLPFGDNEFDAVVCSVSIEYVIRPHELYREVARVLRPGGPFIVTFSHRWFPPKVIRIWEELHEFERMGMVAEYFLRSGLFDGIETFSMRGLPRPENDRYYPKVMVSDPVYAVWGRCL
ncbi:MAG TPA: methyltransferase domain-containing protein [Dissulfurispiraceae bacterium]|nr:methyltransferase domain-containing protein [Dissulfurispiraceae bacterium]